MAHMIQRKEYLDSLISFKEKRLIKVVTGIMRCGKSTLLELFQEYLLQTGVLPEQIIAYNLEAGEYADMKSYRELYDMVTEKLLPDRMNYIFLDEVQHIADFQKVVDGLFIKKTVMCILPVPMHICYLVNLLRYYRDVI